MIRLQKPLYPETSPEAKAMNIAGHKWTLLIVRELLGGPVRFVELQRRLGISTEQLRIRLEQMTLDGLITKTRYREVPPRVDYELTDKGRDLEPVLKSWKRYADKHASKKEKQAA